MRKLLLSAVAMTLLFTACKKDEDNGTGNGLGSNEWKVGGSTYKPIAAAAVQGNSGILIASGMSGTNLGSFTATFSGNAFPTTGGQFKIVDIADAADEVSIMVATNNSSGSDAKSYGSPATTNANATVTVNGGKITISVPEITVTGVASGSTTFSGNATQY